MSIPHVPVDAKRVDWPRLIATAVNALIRRTVQKGNTAIYTAPTISNPPTMAEVQAIADALEAVSDRLK